MRPSSVTSLLFLSSTACARPGKRDETITTTITTTTIVGVTTYYKFLSGSPPAITNLGADAPTTAAPAPAEPTTVTVTSTVTSTALAVEEIIYPCVNMVDEQGPAYGDAQSAAPLGQQNTRYTLDDASGWGATAEGCCNACYFGVANCVQAYWYFYEGCVVGTATNLTSGTGANASPVCPAGTFAGLTYGPDVAPAFRSTGNIAGPCGQGYTNF
ncbi:hypothetical protein GGR54DRAFT_220519 [Hypoxylon sp. NC1633]|nr:hypothetical protein GGR54DRAFT_220519 [Hypoxylon sp. NC1633]